LLIKNLDKSVQILSPIQKLNSEYMLVVSSTNGIKVKRLDKNIEVSAIKEKPEKPEKLEKIKE